jgi:hypothetical protein
MIQVYHIHKKKQKQKKQKNKKQKNKKQKTKQNKQTNKKNKISITITNFVSLSL